MEINRVYIGMVLRCNSVLGTVLLLFVVVYDSVVVACYEKSRFCLLVATTLTIF